MKKVAKKLLSLVVVVCIAFMGVFTVPTFGAKAATTEVVFNMGADGSASHNDGSEASTYTETADGYTLSLTCTKVYKGARDAKGNGCIKLGTGKVVGGFSFTVPSDVTGVVIAVAQYKKYTTNVTVNGTTYAISTASDNGAYTDIEVDTTTTKTVSLSVPTKRAMINTITYVIESSENPTPRVAIMGNASMYIEETQTLEASLKNTTGTPVWKSSNPDVAELVASEDGLTAVVTAKAVSGTTTITLEVDGVTDELEISVAGPITIPEAIEKAKTAGSSYTSEKFYIEGFISNLANTTFGNFDLVDAEGNKLYIYGMYSEDGSIRYDALSVKPVAGDFVRIYGVLGTYKSTPQMKSSWLMEHRAAPKAELNAVKSYMSLAYTYTQSGETFEEDSNFRIRFAVDTALTAIEGVESYGIQVKVGDKVVNYTTNADSWTEEEYKTYVVVALGDIINDLDKLTTEFTVAAYVVFEGNTMTSTATKTYSVATMVAEYYANEELKAAVEHLYNYLNA